MWELSEAGDVEDEGFPPLPPPDSPGHADPDQEEADLSKLGDVPAAKRRTVKRPQPKLDSQRLISDRGLPALRSLFHNVPFQGRGHEEENLQLLLQKMENWAHRLFPRLTFQDFMDKVENLGAKKEVQTCLKRIRLDMPLTHDDFTSEAPQQPEDLDLFTAPVHSTPVPPVAPPVLTEVQRSRMELNRRGALERRRRSQQVPDPSDSSQVLHLSPGGECTSSQGADAQRSSSTERWGEGE